MQISSENTYPLPLALPQMPVLLSPPVHTKHLGSWGSRNRVTPPVCALSRHLIHHRLPYLLTGAKSLQSEQPFPDSGIHYASFEWQFWRVCCFCCCWTTFLSRTHTHTQLCAAALFARTSFHFAHTRIFLLVYILTCISNLLPSLKKKPRSSSRFSLCKIEAHAITLSARVAALLALSWCRFASNMRPSIHSAFSGSCFTLHEFRWSNLFRMNPLIGEKPYAAPWIEW